jgi:hypothetical protein
VKSSPLLLNFIILNVLLWTFFITHTQNNLWAQQKGPANLNSDSDSNSSEWDELDSPTKGLPGPVMTVSSFQRVDGIEVQKLMEESALQQLDTLQGPAQESFKERLIGPMGVKHVLKVAAGVTQDFVSSTVKNITETDLTNPNSYSLGTWLSSSFNNISSALLVRGKEQMDQAIEEKKMLKEGKNPALNLDENLLTPERIIELAEQKLADPENKLTRGQRNIVELDWLPKAISYYRQYLAKKKSASQNSGPQFNFPGEQNSRKRTSAEKEQENRTPSNNLTIAGLVKASQKVLDEKNPSSEVLKTESPLLYNYLHALKEFLNMPSKVQVATDDFFQHSLETNPALGTEDFIQSLKSRAKTLVENASLPFDKQTKRIMVAISGPGTGKTTSLIQMGKWSQHPVCLLTGEAFNSMVELKTEIDKSSPPTLLTPYEIFKNWMVECLQKNFVVETFVVNEGGRTVKVPKRILNGIFLLDDWHVVFAQDGKLSESLFPDSRKKFFALLKNLGDASIENFFDVELAPKLSFPMNFNRASAIITLNKMLPELDPESEKGRDNPALVSRVVSLRPGYPSSKDRISMAGHYITSIKRIYEDKFGPDSFNDEMEKNCQKHILEVLQEDLKILENHSGNIGMRGMHELLGSYKQFVVEKISAVKNHASLKSKSSDLTEKITVCDFNDLSGKQTFFPDKVAQGILDYRQIQNDALKNEEKMNQIKLEISDLQKNVDIIQNLTVKRKVQLILDQIKLNFKMANYPEADNLIMEAKLILNSSLDLPLPIAPQLVGQRIGEVFGDLLINGNEETSSNIDPNFDTFTEILSHIHKNLMLYHQGKPQGQKIFEMIYPSEDDFDLSIFEKFQRVLNLAPIHFAQEKTDIIGSDIGDWVVGLAESDTYALNASRIIIPIPPIDHSRQAEILQASQVLKIPHGNNFIFLIEYKFVNSKATKEKKEYYLIHKDFFFYLNENQKNNVPITILNKFLTKFQSHNNSNPVNFLSLLLKKSDYNFWKNAYSFWQSNLPQLSQFQGLVIIPLTEALNLNLLAHDREMPVTLFDSLKKDFKQNYVTLLNRSPAGSTNFFSEENVDLSAIHVIALTSEKSFKIKKSSDHLDKEIISFNMASSPLELRSLQVKSWIKIGMRKIFEEYFSDLATEEKLKKIDEELTLLENIFYEDQNRELKDISLKRPREILKAIIKFDLELSLLHLKSEKNKISINPLKKSVQNFLELLKNKRYNYFALTSPWPSVETFIENKVAPYYLELITSKEEKFRKIITNDEICDFTTNVTNFTKALEQIRKEIEQKKPSKKNDPSETKFTEIEK